MEVSSLDSSILITMNKSERNWHSRQIRDTCINVQKKIKVKTANVEITRYTFTMAALRAPVKSELSYRNDTVIVFFFAANKNKDNAKVALASCNS